MHVRILHGLSETLLILTVGIRASAMSGTATQGHGGSWGSGDTISSVIDRSSSEATTRFPSTIVLIAWSYSWGTDLGHLRALGHFRR